MNSRTWLRLGVIVLLAGISITLAGCTREKPATAVKPWGTPLVAPGATLVPRTETTPVVGEATKAPEPAITPIGAVVTTPGAGGGTTYTVQRGDNLFRIAQAYGTDVDTLKKLNSLTSDFIYVGQVLRVPEAGATTVSGPKTYVIQRGDTLAIIAQKYGITVDALIKANNITDPNSILVGQSLTIPDSEPVAPAATPTAAAKTYTVQAGDTLAKIAVRYGVTVNDLIKANDLTSPDIIRVGQVLRIP
jgi:LysM repeat protein